MNRHFADYFVFLARHSPNVAGNFSQVQKMIVENAKLIITETSFQSVYVFEWADLASINYNHTLQNNQLNN